MPDRLRPVSPELEAEILASYERLPQPPEATSRGYRQGLIKLRTTTGPVSRATGKLRTKLRRLGLL